MHHGSLPMVAEFYRDTKNTHASGLPLNDCPRNVSPNVHWGGESRVVNDE